MLRPARIVLETLPDDHRIATPESIWTQSHGSGVTAPNPIEVSAATNHRLTAMAYTHLVRPIEGSFWQIRSTSLIPLCKLTPR